MVWYSKAFFYLLVSWRSIYRSFLSQQVWPFTFFFSPHLSTCSGKTDSSLILKYISRKAKTVFWKVCRKNPKSLPRMERCWVVTHMIKKFFGQNTVQISLSVFILEKRCWWSILKCENIPIPNEYIYNVTSFL